MKQLVIIYFITINLVTFIYRGVDKRRAVKNAVGNEEDEEYVKPTKTYRRVPEKKLLKLIALGGSIGAIAGMEFFRHKRRKGSFLWKVLLLVVVHILLFTVFLKNYGG